VKPGTVQETGHSNGVRGPVVTGAPIIVYLYVGQFLSKKRTAAALAELFGTPVSEGTVARMTKRAADGLDGFLDIIRDRIANEQVVGFDETGLRVATKLAWAHCARTDKYTLITCHAKRGRKGIDDAGVLGRFQGVAVHDAWAPYDTYAGVEHQLCCAHALRELQAVAEAATPGTQWCWATQAADALVAMQHMVADAIAAGVHSLDTDALATQVHLYRSAAQLGTTHSAARSDTLMKKHNALARRLTDRQDDYLRFTTNWRIPADNNGSERDIRMIKLRQKVSGCLRTPGTRQSRSCGLEQFEGALSVVGVVSVGGGDVVVSVEAQDADGEAAEGGHDAGCVSGPDQGFVFLVGDVADPVELVFDVPVASDPPGQHGGIGATGIGAGDQVDDFDGLLAVAGDGAPQLGDLGGALELDPGRHGGDFDRAPCPAAMIAGDSGGRRDIGPG